MNLLLLEPGEIVDGRVRLADRRATHLRDVLRVAPGATVRAGVIGGAIGSATVASIATTDAITTVELTVTLDGAPPPPMPIDLVLALPRPKVLSRALETAAAFGVRRVDIVNAWRVDKSYLDSPRLEPASIAEHLRLGAEQGVTTHLPEVVLHRRLMPFLDEHHPAAPAAAASAPSTRLLAHARGAVPIEQAWRDSPRTPVTLAIGPEGGWIEREVETFAARGFAVVTLGAPVLRCEVALAAALGQLALLLRS